MFLKSLHLQNFGSFVDERIELWTGDKPDTRVTVFIGDNGSGKSTVMKAATTLFSWLVARIRSEKGAGSPIDELHIRNGFSEARLSLELTVDMSGAVEQESPVEGGSYNWSLVRPRRGRRRTQESELKMASMLADHLRRRLYEDDNASLPLIAYYPTERYVLDIPKKIRTHHRFEQIDGYDESLTKGIDFRRFFEWFREREDIINEGMAGIKDILPFVNIQKLKNMDFYNEDNIFKIFSKALDKNKLQQKNADLYVDKYLKRNIINEPQYSAVRNAISTVMDGYNNLHIQRRPRIQMLISKENNELNILQLSQGERSLLALVGDIARRLAMMNPGLAYPLQGKGIILIDEIDLHLHPRWQRTVIRRLRETFPNCQFILTTHSPLVISDPDNIRVIKLTEADGGSSKAQESGNLYGMDVEQVLLDIMGTKLRYPDLQDKIDALLRAIQDRDYATVTQLRDELACVLPPDHRELTRADIYLRRQKVLDAKN